MDDGVRRLRPPDLGHGRDGHASQQAAPDGVVLGGLSDGDTHDDPPAGGPGRIRLRVIPDFSGETLAEVVKQTIAPGATLKTDGWAGYSASDDLAHDPHVIGPMAAHIVLPWVHRVFSNLKTWALGVYHGLQRKHLQSYLDAFVFRFNRRRTRHPAFRSLLGLASTKAPITYHMLIAPKAKG